MSGETLPKIDFNFSFHEESNEGKGSAFFFTALFGLDIFGEAEKPESDLAGDITVKATLKRKKILIVEDDETSRFFIQTFLRKNNFDFKVAEDGKMVLELFGTERFDLILMDVQMPVLDGISATEAIRGKEAISGGHTPIVGITAYALAGDKEKCLNAGMDDYISKPIDIRLLYDTINKYMEN